VKNTGSKKEFYILRVIENKEIKQVIKKQINEGKNKEKKKKTYMGYKRKKRKRVGKERQ
jgi:hypothetical protein